MSAGGLEFKTAPIPALMDKTGPPWSLFPVEHQWKMDWLLTHKGIIYPKGKTRSRLVWHYWNVTKYTRNHHMFKTTRWPLVVQRVLERCWSFQVLSLALVLQFFWCLKHATSKKPRLRLWFQPSVNSTWRKLVMMCAGVYRQKILNLFNTTPFMCVQ